jgi:hypothetical protein
MMLRKREYRFRTLFLPFSSGTFATAASAGRRATSDGAYANVSPGFAIDLLSTSSIPHVILDGLYGGFVSSAKETSSVEGLDAVDVDAYGAR